jgi:hypothetical protein
LISSSSAGPTERQSVTVAAADIQITRCVRANAM